MRQSVKATQMPLWRWCGALVAFQLATFSALAWLGSAPEVRLWMFAAGGASSITVTWFVFWRVARTLARQDQRQREAMRSDFAANVSHELRTPITNIKGYVETMLEVGFDDAAQAREFLAIVKRNSDRLAAIVEDLLALAWLEQPGTRGSLAKEMRELRPILESVAAQFLDAASAKNIALAVNAEPTLAAPINAQLIEQAVANYVSNAIKYGPPESIVTVSAHSIEKNESTEAGVIEIAVHDRGAGIAAEHLPHIFERFYRIDKARSRELGGTGLGLAIVKHIALVHGGRVDVESEPGKGSTFKLVLPA